jgi:hypothetical protein
VRQGKWKLHLPRPANPPWLGPFSKNRHIAPEDWAGFDEPFLVDLEADPGETRCVAAEHPKVVERLLSLAEQARADIGDYDRVGENMRFFDPLDERPSQPVFLRLHQNRGKKKAQSNSAGAKQ